MLDKPDISSGLDAGQRLRVGFFLVVQSEPEKVDEAPFSWLWLELVMVEAVEACEESDDDELERCALFRGMNMWPTSSEPIELNPFGVPLPVFHPVRDMGWRFGGGATAVMSCYALRR
jgi:hypothetical protein